MEQERTKYRVKADHTPRQIVDELILRWEVSVLELEDGLEHLEADVQGERNAKIAELKERIQAGRDIVTEFDLNHII